MNAYLSRLNPAERRFVIGVGLLFFVVINIFWVWPRFSDWGDLKRRIENARGTQSRYDALIQQRSKMQVEIDKLRGQGTYVPPEDQFTQFLREIQRLAAQHGVSFTGSSRPNTATNEFFLEQSQTISVTSAEKQLVDFLFALGSGDSLIRVKALSIRPDPTHQLLNSGITLVCSYQKQQRVLPVAAPATKPAAKPAAQPAVNAPKPAAKTLTPLPTRPAPPAKSTPPKK